MSIYKWFFAVSSRRHFLIVIFEFSQFSQSHISHDSGAFDQDDRKLKFLLSKSSEFLFFPREIPFAPCSAHAAELMLQTDNIEDPILFIVSESIDYHEIQEARQREEIGESHTNRINCTYHKCRRWSCKSLRKRRWLCNWTVNYRRETQSAFQSNHG